MKHYEAEAQAALFRWAEWNQRKYPELEFMYAIPNGGSRDKREAANLKRQGMKSGVPDICLPVPRCGYGALFIEMKYGRNRPTKNQERWIAGLRRLGNAAEVCYNWQEAAALIENYLSNKRKENEK